MNNINYIVNPKYKNNINYIVKPEDKNNIKYIVKPEDKMVVGIYELTDPELFDELSNFTSLEREIVRDIILFSNRTDDNTFNVTIKAVAKCHGDDVFDEKYGKKLVEAKIARKRHIIIRKHLSVICDEIYELESKLRGLYRNHYGKLYHINKDLSEYFGLEG